MAKQLTQPIRKNDKLAVLRGQVEAIFHRYGFQQETNSVAMLGALTRKGVKESTRRPRGNLNWFSPFREAEKSEGSVGKAQVVLLSAGVGNKADGNVYVSDVIQRDAERFAGTKCFLDHPGVFDEQNRPEREVSGIAGWFSNVRAESIDGVISILAELNYMQHTDGTLTESGEKARGLCESAMVYQRQNGADKCLLGLSINAEGPSHVESADVLAQKYPMFAEALAGRSEWNLVDGIESVTSVDLVTFPARGGKVLGLKEAQAFMESERWRASFRHSLGKI